MLHICIAAPRSGSAGKASGLSLLAALSLSQAVAPAASAQIAFTDVSSTAGVAQVGESYGASWGDLNGDGYPDIFASNHRLQPSLFLNMGDGTFFETGPQVLTWQNRSNADTHGGSWADFDNDGDQDLLVSTGTGNLSQFLVNERGRLVDRAVERGLNVSNIGGRLPVWLDYNGDNLLDFVMTQYGGIAKLYRQNADGTFTDQTSAAKLVCKRFLYGHLFDVTGDGRLDFLCPDEGAFPQKIYDTQPFPWVKLYDATAPTALFPMVAKVPDSNIADFDNDGRMDMFLLSSVQLRPSSVVQAGPNYLEAQLTGGTKGFKFVSAGAITVFADWNKADEGTVTDLAKIQIGAGSTHPTTIPFTLDPTDPNVLGMPPLPTVQSQLPAMQVGYDQSTHRWTFVIQTKLTTSSVNVFSEAYIEVDTAVPLSSLVSTGLWPSDKTGRPTLLMNTPSGFSDTTVAAGLGQAVQCGSVTVGDYDNDMDMDIYLACRTGASNISNVLYANQGNGTFVAVPNAGGAAGPTGIAVQSGAGTADTAITADYDVDGFLDLFVTNGFNLRPLYYGGKNSLFRNQGNANHWIEIDLVGTQSDREAVGARIEATANGVVQYRVQNGAYHRWAQDARRSHFGLASASTVDLRVLWPSGAVEEFTGVAADQLYRITEGSGIAPVALGVAPAYPCGAPPLNGTLDTGVFIWRDCPSGQWRLKTAAGGSSETYIGKISSSANFVSVTPVGLDAGDAVDSTSNPTQISFVFATSGSETDGVNFNVADGTSNCLKLDAPSGVQVFYGPFRVPFLAQPFDLDTQSTCAGLPPELSVTPITVAEAAGQADFAVTLSPASDQTVTVDYATSDVTAVSGQDYTAVTSSLTFAPGETSLTVSVPILEDALAEGDETFQLSLSNPANAVLALVSQTTATIEDNEISPCGTPSYNAGTTAAAFVWRDCTTGKWTTRFTAGGSSTTLTYNGSVSADAAFTSVQRYSIESTDVLNTTNPAVISFTLKMNGTGQDGFSFTLPGGATACFGTTLPAGAAALVGAAKTPVAAPFRLDTLGPCL